MQTLPITSLPLCWKELLSSEFEKSYMAGIEQFLCQQIKAGKIIYPRQSEIFQAFIETPVAKVKVVLIGQDPYHGPGQAHGMSFSVPAEVKIPPSLRNIYKELSADLGLSIPKHGFLKAWANSGVLLLNSVLTVEDGRAGGHQKKGWETFTDSVVKILNLKCDNLVFLLWGAQAQKKGVGIDRQRHLVLESAHPSPLSAYRGFLGNKHFSKTNEFLRSKNIAEINWNL
ncbi:MAG: uracil-DNA glycosylase [Halobacteriovoraceae bacterium]|jgi:uracil-DNA glycosylase|nr:uracil-DNA glycosylase [Halobacteriovoraceae bacterium]MBT5093677.1 uracil-DNA glycosylase [Halobacteriovoraceae bacterium]